MTLNEVSWLFRAGPKAFVSVIVMLISATAHSSQSSVTDFDADGERLLPDNLPSSFYTVEPQEYWREPKDSYWLNFSNWVISQERAQGQRVQSIGEWADRTLSGSSQALPDNESYIRVGFATESEHGSPAGFEPEARFRLDVPTVKRKLRLVVESESDELIPLSERRRA